MVTRNLYDAWRAFRKYKFYSTLNVLGFSFALIITILISLFAHRELSTNMFHRDVKRIYKISGWGCPYALAGTIGSGVPEIEAIANVVPSGNAFLKLEDGKEIVTTETALRVDPPFFDIFTFPIVQGNKETPLPDKQSIVLTESTARALFEDRNPIGQTVLLYGFQPYVVTAVARDVPRNSSIRFSAVFALDPSRVIGPDRTLSQDWSSWNYEIFAKIAPGQSVPELDRKIQDVVERNGNLRYEVERVKLYPLSDVYFNYADLFTRFKGGNYGQVKAMIWVGIIILLLAIVNFFNLSTASGMMRSKEIGLRKVNGSLRSELAARFLTESVLTTFCAMLIALIGVNIAIPFFRNFVEAEYDFIFLTHAWEWGLLLGGSLLVGVLAGSYPAFYLSSIDPIKALYSERVRTGLGVVVFRRVLIIFQLTASIILIACTFIISGQLKHLRTKDLGFDKENLVFVRIDQTIYEQKQAFLSKIMALPMIDGVSLTENIVGNADLGNKLKGNYYGEEIEIWSKFLNIDTAFFSTFGIEMVEGRAPLGHENGRCVVMNEAAVRALSIDDPLNFLIEYSDTTTLRVVGICKDFNFKPLNQGIEPLVMLPKDIQYGLINMHYRAGSVMETKAMLEQIEEVYNSFQPENQIGIDFLDEYLGRLYRSEMKFRTIFTIFSVLAITISGIGLAGLIVFTNARRRKEIGVRRVQGSTILQVIVLLVRSYLGYVGIAFVLAVPVTYLLMIRWLSDYPYQAPMQWWHFALAGLIALVLVVLSVGLQSWRAARANPINSLKSE